MSWLKRTLGLNHPTEDELHQIQTEIVQLRKEKESLLNDLSGLSLAKQLAEKELIETNEAVLLQSFGLYEPKFKLPSSADYKDRLISVRENQKKMMKYMDSCCKETSWTVNGSKSEGRKMVRDVIKLLIIAFNLECESLIDGVKFSNLDSHKQRMTKTFESINKYGRVLGISILEGFLELKIHELELSYECEIKKQEEKDLAALKREQLREEQKVLREIESMKQKIIKEETHFRQAIATANDKLSKAITDNEKDSLLAKIAELEFKLAGLEKDKQDVYNREQNTRAGYVYVISNIGAFGENVYKIGVTRRLEPRDRVRELGDASVPFHFDIHALIFSDDAPALEYTLHKTFEDRRINRLNPRKEFFRVSLSEIENVIKNHLHKDVDLITTHEAPEYRMGLKMVTAVPVIHENSYYDESDNTA